MKTYSIPLDRIRPNPWQTRQGVDADYIRELAADIRRRGLLQPPAGRFVDGDGKAVSIEWIDRQLLAQGMTRLERWSQARQGACEVLEKLDLYIQLSFGHNRWLAFKHLAYDEDLDGYGAMPVQLQDLGDEDMAEAAWAENAQRKDLSPIEEALAIKQRMADFGWTQADVAERLGLARSTVANKLRLLDLPADIQASLADGEISERAASALLPLAQLPDEVRERGEDLPSWDNRRFSKVLERAKAGASSDELRRRTTEAIERVTTPMERAGWPIEHHFEDVNGLIRRFQCSECPLLLERAGELRCGDPDCFDLKAAVWYQGEMAKATAATGLPAMPRGEYATEAFTYEPREWLEEIVRNGCEHLHLAQRSGVPVWEIFDDVDEVDVEARVVCYRENYHSCTCLRALKAGSDKAQAKRAREKELKRQYHERLLQPATSALANAIREAEAGAWRVVMGALTSSMRGKGEDWDLEQISQKMAKVLLEMRSPYYDPWEDLAKTATKFEEVFAEAGLEPPWDDEVRALADWKERVDRTTRWVRNCRDERPTLEQVRGNLANLQELSDWGEGLLEAFGEEQVGEAFDEVVAAQEILTQVLAVLSNGDLAGEDFEQARQVTWRYVGADDYEELLQAASAPALAYALAFCSADPEDVRRRRILARLTELRQREAVPA